MKDAVEKLVEAAAKDRKLLQNLKSAAVEARLYEVAADLRDKELTKYPKANTQGPWYKEAERVQTAFRMVDIGVSAKVAWLVHQVSKELMKSEDFDLKQAAQLQTEAEEIFG